MLTESAVAGLSVAQRNRDVLVEDNPVAATPELEACLNRVEYYQPLYGITGFEHPMRNCRDRAIAIAEALAPMGTAINLVDFGSSLGYFPFYFADRGASATGFDINANNTAVALATRHLNGLPAQFHTAELSLETVRQIPAGQYDVALILSVLHHITHKHGLPYVIELMSELSSRIPTLILELAHRDEEVRFAWRNSLPQSPLEILASCPDVKVQRIAEFSSHLSGSTRPMFMITRD